MINKLSIGGKDENPCRFNICYKNLWTCGKCCGIKPENHFHLLENGYYKFKVVNCERDVLPKTSSKPARPIIRLRLDIENDEANVVINHIIFLNQYNNKEIHEFFSSIGLAEDREYITKWNVWGRTGACKVIRKDLDFKTVNAIDHFVTQN